VKERIIELIRELGPIVPNEISGKLEANSFLVSALMSELVREKRLLYSHKKLSNSPLYYVQGQEDLVRRRLNPLLKIPEKKIVEFFEKNKLALKDNLSPQQRYMVDELKDYITSITLNIDGEEKKFYKNHNVSDESIRDSLKNMKPVKEESPKPQPSSLFGNSPQTNKPMTHSFFENKKEDDFKFFEKPKQEVVVEKPIQQVKLQEVQIEENSLYFDRVSSNFFDKNNLNIVSVDVVKKGKEANFVIKSGFNQEVFVKYFVKNSINETDVSKAFTESHVNKLPCWILTKAKVNKKAQKLLDNLGKTINLISI